jgi:hypothetical protein
MPTSYDILPTLQKELTKLLGDFMKADNGAFHDWEILVFLPASNAFIHYLAGLNISLKNDNYMSAMANLRGMLEALGAVVYDGTAKLSKTGYDRFLKTGRLPKRDADKEKWGDLGPRESVKYAQLVVNQKIKLLDIYDSCCDILHFSATHMSFMGGFEPKLDENKRTVRFGIGAKDNIPVKTQREMIDLCVELTTALGKCVNAGIEEKTNRHTSRPT